MQTERPARKSRERMQTCFFSIAIHEKVKPACLCRFGNSHSRHQHQQQTPSMTQCICADDRHELKTPTARIPRTQSDSENRKHVGGRERASSVFVSQHPLLLTFSIAIHAMMDFGSPPSTPGCSGGGDGGVVADLGRIPVSGGFVSDAFEKEIDTSRQPQPPHRPRPGDSDSNGDGDIYA